ncbi:MAG: adenosine kinase [Parachlamydiaceae bacterium]|nr:adenosine kinase [Parachlamydiaceae bacterium]
MPHNTSNVEVIGIGAPIIDYILDVSETFIQQLPGAKGGMTIINHDAFNKILNACDPPTLRLGGSSANTVRGLASLGNACAFIGKTGRDEAGKAFYDGLKALGIPMLLKPVEQPTSQVLCLVTPDKERTMRAFLGASTGLTVEDLHPEFFKGVKLVHFEGYNLLNPALIRKAMMLAKKAGARVSLDLGSFEVVKANKGLIAELLTRYVDVVFANQDEVYALTGLKERRAGEVLKDFCSTVVVLMGEHGCWVMRDAHAIHRKAIPVEAPVDTTGAGDLFASGFLHGYLQGLSLEECAHYGAMTGAAVVQVKGVELTQEQWSQLRADFVKNIK